MKPIRAQLTFPTLDKLKDWAASVPPHGSSFWFDPEFIPKDSVDPRSVAEIFPEASKATSRELELRSGGDPWEAAAAIAHGASFGAQGRAVLVEVDCGWVEEDDDPRDAQINVFLDLTDGATIACRTLSGRQARWVLEHDGPLPSLKEMKAILRAERASKKS